jgi:hypothetical protein
MGYKYSPLNFEDLEVKFIQLLSGEFNDDIQIIFFHVSFRESHSPLVPAIGMEVLNKTLRDGWQAVDTLEGRAIFSHNKEQTSWPHLDVGSKYSTRVVCQKAHTSEIQFEARSYA